MENIAVILLAGMSSYQNMGNFFRELSSVIFKMGLFERLGGSHH